MKKDLNITGKIELTRVEVVKIVSEYLKVSENLIVEKAVSVDVEEKPMAFENLICYVHQATKDKVIKDYDDPKKINSAVGLDLI